MVQYVFTPWRDRRELLLVRQQFYASPSVGVDPGAAPSRSTLPSGGDEGAQDQRRQQDQHKAVARVSMWMQRGHCPHMVESTALLTAALLSDEEAAVAEKAASSTYALRAAYSAAFSRFVTGLLDSHQDKLRKQSMYTVAKSIGLPATFVELRHQSTHEQLPSRAKLKSAAVKALDWIWEYYWKHLADGEAVSGARSGSCVDAVRRYLRENDEGRQRKLMEGLLRQWEHEQLLEAVAEMRRTVKGNGDFIKTLRLESMLATAKGDQAHRKLSRLSKDLAPGSAEMDDDAAATMDVVEPPATTPAAKQDTGWTRYQGTWKPKPIGVV